MTTHYNLLDETKLDPGVAKAYVAGWINAGTASFQVLQADGSFGSPGANIPFYPVTSVPRVRLSQVNLGGNQLLFVVSPTEPTALNILNNGPQKFGQYPYGPSAPNPAAPGPFDILEFGFKAQCDVSAVSGFGLNLRFSVAGTMGQRYGVNALVTRKQIGEAYKAFILREIGISRDAHAFLGLLYDKPVIPTWAPPPTVDGQYFAISDPNDMLGALTGNFQNPTSHKLATYWDDTLKKFFADGNWLSVNLSNDAVPNVYSGQCSAGTYTLGNGSKTYTFLNPLKDNPHGFAGAYYVFGQAFGPYTPSGSGGDAGALQDNIWMALCRGVALAGVATKQIGNGESTGKWNDWKSWYGRGATCDLYAKFLHYSDANGGDSRTSGQPPIFIDHAAYGFGEDENPSGPYGGPPVPSKSPDVPDGATVDVHVGQWA